MKKLILNEIHVSLGAKMMPFAGFDMPVRYSSDKEEHMTVRKGVGVFDVSHMGEFTIKGPGALELIQKISSNDVLKLIDGQAQYSCMPNESGGIIDDLIIYRFKEDDYMLVVNASNIDKDWKWITDHNSQGVQMTNISDEICLLAVQGPDAVKAIQPIASVDLSEIKFYHFTKGSIGGVSDVIISGTGYTGSGGFELYVKSGDAQTLWKALFESGKSFGIKPIGLGARDTLRLEMGFCLYGNDITDDTSPLEAGLGWITKFNKEFVNSKNLMIQKEEGIKRRLVGFEMIDRGIPRKDYEIYDRQENKLGVVTSGSLSPVLERGIGMGYVIFGNHKPGTEISILVRSKFLKAIIKKLPFIS